jgi:hypothetical protein
MAAGGGGGQVANGQTGGATMRAIGETGRDGGGPAKAGGEQKGRAKSKTDHGGSSGSERFGVVQNGAQA